MDGNFPLGANNEAQSNFDPQRDSSFGRVASTVNNANIKHRGEKQMTPSAEELANYIYQNMKAYLRGRR